MSSSTVSDGIVWKQLPENDIRNIVLHEFGHALGLPDLYDTDYSSSGIGNWGVMSGGSWGGNGSSPWYPVHFSAWCKTTLGWV